MYLLNDVSPDVALQFKQGKFAVNKTSKNFSSIPIDHAHEQNNALVKVDGGAVGLTGNPSALRRWMVSGPEIARIISKFENSMVLNRIHTSRAQCKTLRRYKKLAIFVLKRCYSTYQGN